MCFRILAFAQLWGPRLATSFSNNCLKNGVLVVRLDPRFVVSLFSALEASPGSRVVIDLPAQTVRAPDGTRARFDIDAFYKAALLAGRDEIDITLQLASFIDAYEAAHGIGPHGREKDQEDRPNRQGAP